MKLNNARLCLDCDEVHDEAHCPSCASESFAFIKRWVTTPEARARAAVENESRTERARGRRPIARCSGANHDPSMTRRLVRGGVVGLAVLGAAGWLLQRNAGEKNKAEPDDKPDEPTTDN